MKKSYSSLDESLKRLEELDKIQQQLASSLSGTYGDFFGGGNTFKENKSSDSKPADNPAAKPVTPDAAVTQGKNAVSDAQDALKEAQAVFGKPEPAKPKEPETDPMEDLEKLIGLAGIKHDVKELTDFVKIQKMRKDQGMKSVPVSLHLVFTGNPGTGKTTVARILARLYKQIGVLTTGQLVEVDRGGLVAGYVGQTAIKTQEKIQQAMGGVLFIDEAYSLSQENDAFGQEAIDTILKAMEDNRDNFVVIVAGYTQPMEKFINSNPGLKSRFNKYIEFPDYSIDELEQIFEMNCNKYDYVIDDSVKAQVRAMIVGKRLDSLENFANAREVRNLFEDIITNQARRGAAITEPTKVDMRKILMEDLMDSDPEEEEKPVEKTPAAEDTAVSESAVPDSAAPDTADTTDVPAPDEEPTAEPTEEA